MISDGNGTRTGACSTTTGPCSNCTDSSAGTGIGAHPLSGMGTQTSTSSSTNNCLTMSPLPPLNSAILAEILSCYRALSKLPTLDPSPQVNALFGKLVQLCSQTPDDATATKILTDPRIVEIVPQLRKLCADGEYRLESYWVEKILRFETQKEVNSMLLNFTYYSNYVDLIKMELNAISTVSPSTSPPRKFAILGSGPLPLTSLCILETLSKSPDQNSQKHPPVTVHNVDHDQHAIRTSSELCRKLGYSTSEMRFHCADVKSHSLDLDDFDVVYLAALVGMSSELKGELVEGIVRRMKPGALLLLRSAHSLRGLLYPVVDLTDEMASMGLQTLLVVHPYNHIINSIIVTRVGFPAAPATCLL